MQLSMVIWGLVWIGIGFAILNLKRAKRIVPLSCQFLVSIASVKEHGAKNASPTFMMFRKGSTVKPNELAEDLV